MKQEVPAVLWGEVGWFLYETRSAGGHGGIDERRSACGPVSEQIRIMASRLMILGSYACPPFRTFFFTNVS